MKNRDGIAFDDIPQIPGVTLIDLGQGQRPRLAIMNGRLISVDDLPKETCDHSHYDERIHGYYCYCGKLMATWAD